MLLFKKKENFEVAETVIQQQIDNAELIGNLLRQQYDLMGSVVSNISDDIWKVVDTQQKAIRDLQKNIITLQLQLNMKDGEA